MLNNNPFGGLKVLKRTQDEPKAPFCHGSIDKLNLKLDSSSNGIRTQELGAEVFYAAQQDLINV